MRRRLIQAISAWMNVWVNPDQPISLQYVASNIYNMSFLNCKIWVEWKRRKSTFVVDKSAI